MSSITKGLKIPRCWLGMFPSNAFQRESADLFSAGTAPLCFLKSSIGSGQAKEKYCTSSIRALLPSSSFCSWSKRERNDRKCELPASPPSWGSPEAPVTAERCSGPESLTGSSSALVWGETRGGKGHCPELLLDTGGRREEPWAESFAGCGSRALAHTDSLLDTLTSAQWHQELSLLPWAEHLGRDLLPLPRNSPCHGAALGAAQLPGLQR